MDNTSPAKRIIDLWVTILLWILYLNTASGQFDANFTLQNVWGRLHDDSRSIIQCLSNDSYKAIKFSRKLDTGQGARLPRFSQQILQGKPVSARILFMPGEGKMNRFGVFQCKIDKNKVTTEIVTLKLPPPSVAELDAVSPYNVVNVGDDVELEVSVLQEKQLPIKWKHNGVDLPDWDDTLKVEIQDAKTSDAGIYECYYDGRRSEGVHALLRLIVRGCPKDMYGDDCDQKCPPCYNGGVCHEKWGMCICPAGFAGLDCGIACGGNHFGPNCFKACSPPNENSQTDELCASHLFCKPDPYGCSCAPGFKGSSCMEHCEPGWYGADCKQPCHCLYGTSTCNRITGACDGGCARGWRGDSCQIEDPNANSLETTTMAYCPLGSYGPSCERKCRCARNEHCNVVTGHCAWGCAEGWGGSSCGVCFAGKFGDNCEFNCHCEGGHHDCDNEGHCLTGCKAGWAGVRCQTECTPGRFGPNCAKPCHCHENSTSPCDKVTGVCEGDCEAGYMGDDCQTLCPHNRYGVNCLHSCTCLNEGHCNRIDGSCACVGRWKAKTCNESEPQIVAATDEEVNVGQQVYISCTADAVPEPTMNISSSHFPGLNLILRTPEKYQVQAFVKMKPKEAGKFEFMCTARNDHGFDMKKITVTVIAPPRLTTPPRLLDKSNHSLTVSWTDWEFGVDEGGTAADKIEYSVVYREAETSSWERVDGWSTDSTAKIENLTPNTDYEVAVKCRRPGNGDEGDVSPELYVTTDCGVPTEDAIPQELLPDMISQTTVSLTWKKPYDQPLRCLLTGYHLTFHPEGNEIAANSLDLDADANVAKLEELLPNTAYVIRLYAVTTVTRSSYPAELTVLTYETVPDPVTHLECRAVEDQPQLLLVSWEAPSDVNGVIKGYVINYSLMDKGRCGQSHEGEDTGTRQMLSNDTEITLQNLHPYSTYNVSVQARTSAGESEPVSVIAETAQAAPEESPPNVRLISSTSHSLEFRWDPVPCEFANGIITHYQYMVVQREDIYPTHLKLRKKRSLDVPFPDSSLPIVEGLQVEIKNLQPDTEYGFVVKGVVARTLEGPPSDIVFHKTDEDLPSQPQYLVVISATSTTIGLSWSEPEIPNGRVVRYRIQLWDHESSNLAADVLHDVKEEYEDQLSTTVEGLAPATDFFIKIQAATSAGWGEFCSPISGRTLDGVPGEPSEVAVVGSGQRILNITWEEPVKKNGDVTGYRVAYRPVLTLDPVFNATPFVQEQREVDANARKISLTGLHPSTEYALSVAAKTSAGYGMNATINSWTVILGDHVSPTLTTLQVNVTNETIPITFSTTGSTSVYKYQVIVEDSRNRHPIDESELGDFDTAVVQKKLPYYIAAELDPRNVTSDGEQSFVVGDNNIWGGYKNVHLNPGHVYKIRIRTLVYKDDSIKSVLSKAEEETAASTVVEVNKKHQKDGEFVDLLALILIAVAVLVLITAISGLIILVICNRRRRKTSTNSFSTRDSGLSSSMTWSVMYKSPENEAMVGLVSEGYKTFPLTEKHASLKRTKSDSKIARGLRIEALEEFLINAMATNQLAEEFKRLVEGQTSPWTVARKNSNLKKNRYGNILPYDRSRVALKSVNSKNDSDYINASYIDGYRRPREYIVTQGPMDNTISDFWRMVWQENSPVIVMVTDLIENGKQKCSKYWPDDSMDCGDIQILLIRSEDCRDFVVRTLLVRRLDEIRTHRVVQYQYTSWPDRTVPLNTNHFIKFMKRIRSDHPVMGGPIIVHCSAGAGRSGTYVAIDALCQQAEEDRRVEVFRFVNNARHQRVHLVQTLEQYAFIYEALVEAVHFEDTTVPLDKIGFYLKELSHMSTLDQRALIIRQYNKLNRTQKKVDTSRCAVALSEENIFKNRDPLTVPMDTVRVKLLSDDEDSVDYINAVFVDGLNKKSAYIVTQMPLTHTIHDFWKMIYEHRSSLIVALNGTDNSDDLDMGIYWPDDGNCAYGEFLVQIITFEQQGDFVTRIMRLTHTEKNGEPMKVIQLHYKGWTSEMKPESVLKLLQNVEICYQKSEGGPITVHCMDGATRSGLFVATRNICEQIKEEGVLDAYQAVKSIRASRPEFIPNSDQFRFLFEVAQEVAEPIISQWAETIQPVKKISFKI